METKKEKIVPVNLILRNDLTMIISDGEYSIDVSLTPEKAMGFAEMLIKRALVIMEASKNENGKRIGCH